MQRRIVTYGIISFLLGILSLSLHAQQGISFSQYMFNQANFNPAYTGNHEMLSITASNRQQWTGIPGAPVTYIFTAHSPLKNGIDGLGVSIEHDEIGVTKQTRMFGMYSHKVLFANSTLSLGLQAGGFHYRVNLSELDVKEEESIFLDDVNSLLPNFGAGALFYSKRGYYIGFSVPHFVSNPIRSSSAVEAEARIRRRYLLTGGMKFPLSAHLELKPNVLVKMEEGTPVQYDLNVNLEIWDKYWVGVSLRSLESIDLIAVANIGDNFRVGYSYDFIFTDVLRTFAGSTHEFMLNFRLSYLKDKDTKKPYNPRHF